MARNSAGTLWLSNIDQDDVALVGEKAAILGGLTRSGYPIPEGFIVTSAAYFHFLSEHQLQNAIEKQLSTVNFDLPESLMQVSQLIQKQIREAPMPKELLHEIDTAYQKLGGILKHTPVAIRPSSIASDLLTPVFTGEAETILNSKGEANLILHLREVWASLFTPQAILARHQQHVSHFKFGTAVLVQRMIHHEQSGVMLTVDPTSNDTNTLIIEAAAGAKTSDVVPDHYVVTKKDLRIKANPGSKNPVLSENQVMKLAVLGKRLSSQLYFPQEITWASEKGEIFFLSVTQLAASITKKEASPSNHLPLLCKGIGASAGMHTGHVRLVKSTKELYKLVPGEVLVIPQLTEQFLASVNLIKKAGAIVADTGGKTAHLTHVFRELGIPAVVGTGNATTILHTGQVVTVNGSTGEVAKASAKLAQHTATKVYVNLAQAAYADVAVDANADGIGLLCPDCLMTDLGIYRHAYLEKGRQREYSEKLAEHLLEVCKTFMPHPVMYELKFQESELFALEVAALKLVHEKQVGKNVGIVLSAIRTVDDLREAKKALAAGGLSRSNAIKLWLMVETPAQVIQLESYISAGIDGVTIGSQTLTMLMLGSDDERLDEKNPAVMWAIEQVIKTAHKHHIASSFCGQAASIYPSLIIKLVEWGISSISVAPSVVETARTHVAKAERELVEKRSPKKKH